MIEVSALSKYYAGQPAIHDVSFSIKSGEIIGLLGLNGAGKSTILKILGTFLMPSTGEARIDGYSVVEEPEVVRRLIGFLPDTPPLYDEMPVESYLRYVAGIKNVPKAKVHDYVTDVMQRTHVEDVRHTLLKNLSHGYRQRVGIAQAIVHKPSVLILDEPINGLDPVQIVEMRDLILSLRGEHTVILSSHILSEITKTCDRIFVVHQGQLVAQGKESELLMQKTSDLVVTCVVKNIQGVEKSLQELSGVKSVHIQGSGPYHITLELKEDIRPDIARLFVQSGCELLSMNVEGEALEKIFLKFVGAGQQ